MSDKTKTFSTRIKSKRDTSANWESANPVLLNGEKIIVDTAAGEVREKIGDGVKTYSQLPFTDEKIRGLITEKADEVELERLKYYGDKDIIPSPESYFTVNSTGETITGLTDTGKTQTELVIPYKINGKKITTLFSGSSGTPVSILDGNSTITKVVIPESVTTLGMGAFYICPSLSSINIPNSVTSIGSYAFSDCSALTSVNIPNSVTSIGNGAFSNCASLTSINISNSVTSIGSGAFYGCTSLTSINIPNSVTSIGGEAFNGCSSLTSINIPNSVTNIGGSAFNGCLNLKIYCEQGSYAETYAKKHNIPVVYTEIAAAEIDKKANDEDVITKTNTTAFAPTGDYQPATKKYVDDNISAAGGGDMLKSVYDMDGDGIVDNAEKLGGQLPSYYATATAVNGKAPTSHASSASTYGVGTSSSYGHLKLANNLTTTTTSGYALNAAQGKALKDLIDAITPTPPTLTSATADGTAIGADGWTGTGWFCTAANKKYAVNSSNDVDTSLGGFNRFCLKPASNNGEWQNWTPYIDLNGTAYEFYYVPGRGLYETLIPASTSTAAQIVASVRWENHAPTVLHYGKASSMVGAYAPGCLNADSSSTEDNQAFWVKDAFEFRKNSMPLIADDYIIIQNIVQGVISLDFSALGINDRIFIYLTLDVAGSGNVNGASWMGIRNSIRGLIPHLAIYSIDNF